MPLKFAPLLLGVAVATIYLTDASAFSNKLPKASSSSLGDPDVKPGLLEAWNQGYQTWTLRQPKWSPFYLLIPPLRLIERIQIATSTAHEWFYHKRTVFGDNFCAQGCVFMSDFKEVERALTSPQARTTNLGAITLEASKLPDKTKKNGRMLFLLALSDKEAGGNGDREAFRAAIGDTLIQSEGAKQRQTDATTKALLRTLARDYQEMGHAKEFFEDERRGLNGFFMKFLHHVVFNIDPSDEDTIETLTKFHYDGASAAYYLKVFEKLLQKFAHPTWPQQAKDVAKIYMDSPEVSKFVESDPKYNHLTKSEMAELMKAIMSIAALVGPKTLALNAMGYDQFPKYNGKQANEIDVTQIWDQLDLENREEVANYLFECGRLKLPVATAHRVATERFAVPIRGKMRSFPSGTKIIIPMSLSMVDEDFWGPTAFEFNHKRENVCPFSMMFNSVGDRDAGRICPGREIAMDILTDIMIELGKVRRSSPFKTG